ncbi:hypothetical protein OCU04_000437 [Sclerotinia nivalis]|uniref:Methyltransferase n=1 Tax=Sclerotinia nivalis TaxID=352851 RepID=A0A9X0DNE7_9HELO|nr:hypothetical protein OCU04_000437 [Sclerotinia nivalis]
MDKFWAQAAKALKPGGTVALWTRGSTLCSLPPILSYTPLTPPSILLPTPLDPQPRPTPPDLRIFRAEHPSSLRAPP